MNRNAIERVFLQEIKKRVKDARSERKSALTRKRERKRNKLHVIGKTRNRYDALEKESKRDSK